MVDTQKQQNKKGAATVYTLIIMSVLSVVLLGLISFVLAQMKYSFHQAARAEALQIAEAGVHFYRWYLSHQTDGKTAQQIEAFWASGEAYGITAPYERTYADRGTFRITVTPPAPGQTSVVVESQGWTTRNPNVTRTVRVRLRRPSWSEYAILSDADTRFGDGTTVFGPLHSNGGIRFDGVAYNTVSSARETYTDPDTGLTQPGVWTSWPGGYNTSMNSTVFVAGTEFPVSGVDFGSVTTDISLMRTEAQTNGVAFDDAGYGRHIILHPDGTFEARVVTQYDTESNGIIAEGSPQVYTIPNNSIIYVDDNIWVEGRIDGAHVSIVAGDHTGAQTPRILIGKDVLYTSYDGSDIIGLVATGDIEIIRDSEDDLRIDAALLSQSGRIGRAHYGWYCNAWWWFWCIDTVYDIKTTITINGALATYQRYGFAWTDGTGYINRNLIYDNHLLYQPPPFFPTGTHYIPDLWEER